VQSEGRTKFDLVYRVSTAPLCVVHGFFCADSILRGDSTVKLPDDMFCCHSLFENICICIGEIGCCKDIRFDFVSIVVVPFCPFTFLFLIVPSVSLISVQMGLYSLSFVLSVFEVVN